MSPRFAKISEVLFLVVHHSASPVHWSFNRMRDIHLDKGWLDVGYHFGIERDGALRYGRPLWAAGSHCPPYNRKSWGVCVIGDNTTPDLDAPADMKWRRHNHRWTEKQWQALEVLVHALRVAHPRIEIIGHRELGRTATDCPGLDSATIRTRLGIS